MPAESEAQQGQQVGEAGEEGQAAVTQVRATLDLGQQLQQQLVVAGSTWIAALGGQGGGESGGGLGGRGCVMQSF